MLYSIYVKVTNNNYIKVVESSAFLTDTSNWIKIDEGDEREDIKYRHAQSNYFPKQLRTNGGAYQYKLVDGAPKECTSEEIAAQEKSTADAINASTNKARQVKSQMNRAIQLFAMTLPEETALEIPYVFDSWENGRTYNTDEYFTYGVNSVGDPQLYRVVQGHTSQKDWAPGKIPSLYSPIGLDDSGYPVWAQPTGAHDAYDKDDIVDYANTLYKSLIDGNVWSPDAYPDGWKKVETT